ncbi:MAG: hypothetical protein ACJ747_10690 [Gaiellaceae bacterium]|nr:hypothetical protein [Acidobacteriota bacterium]
MDSIRADRLLALPVRLHGISLGRPADVLLDRNELRAVGLDLICGDDIHRFLPYATAAIHDDEIAIPSPLVLLEEDELAFYRARTFSLAALRRGVVERGGRPSGTLVDVVLLSDGRLAEMIVERGGVEKRIDFDASVRFVPATRSAA